MTLQQQQFLELLRAGLWGTPANVKLLNGNVDWRSILRIAMEQTVQVIIADGIATLPKELWPPKEAMLKLMMVRVKTHQMHQLLNSTLNQIINILNAEGIPSVLLKGQGVAQNYRNPESRMCGDIDLYVGVQGYNKACELISKIGNNDKDINECLHHTHLQVNGVEIEVHRYADFIFNKRKNRKLQNWTQISIDHHFNAYPANYWNNNGTIVHLAPHTFNSFFILHHAVRHMTADGIGLRQICDWVMYLHKYHTHINVIELSNKLKEFDMMSVWEEFSILAVTMLGLPKESCFHLPQRTNLDKTEKLINHIFTSGNFGRYDNIRRNLSPAGYLKRKWRNFYFQFIRFIKLFGMFPKYIINYALGWFGDSIRRLIVGK